MVAEIPATMLFLAVASIPPLMRAANVLEIAGSLLIGTAYLSLVAWLAEALAARPAKRLSAPKRLIPR